MAVAAAPEQRPQKSSRSIDKRRMCGYHADKAQQIGSLAYTESSVAIVAVESWHQNLAKGQRKHQQMHLGQMFTSHTQPLLPNQLAASKLLPTASPQQEGPSSKVAGPWFLLSEHTATWPMSRWVVAAPGMPPCTAQVVGAACTVCCQLGDRPWGNLTSLCGTITVASSTQAQTTAPADSAAVALHTPLDTQRCCPYMHVVPLLTGQTAVRGDRPPAQQRRRGVPDGQVPPAARAGGEAATAESDATHMLLHSYCRRCGPSLAIKTLMCIALSSCLLLRQVLLKLSAALQPEIGTCSGLGTVQRLAVQDSCVCQHAHSVRAAVAPQMVSSACCFAVACNPRCSLQDYAWKDYVRGKDLQKFLAGQQELLDRFTKQQGPGRC